MMRPPLAAAAVFAAAAAGALAGCGATPTTTSPATTPAPPLRTTAVAPTPREDRAPSGDAVARITRRTTLRSAPAGRRVATIGPDTEWGTPRYLPVVRRRDGWLGVVATEVPNGRLAWVRASATRPAVSQSRVVVDLSRRRLRVVDLDGRTLLRVTVGVGAAATPTPTGRFAITDGLRTEPGSPYGCCILALSGHQPNVPQGWTGGDRLAIHGTDDPASIGAAASSGCLRASDDDVRRLMARVGLGALVEIRA
jgi:lipoprotein-anchoring transpeptidase ErfK/SrfK